MLGSPPELLPHPLKTLRKLKEELNPRESHLFFSPAPTNHQHTGGAQTYSLHPHLSNFQSISLGKGHLNTLFAPITLITHIGSDHPEDTNTIHYSFQNYHGLFVNQTDLTDFLLLETQKLKIEKERRRAFKVHILPQ